MTFFRVFAFVAGVQAHSFFHKTAVNDVDQGELNGIRLPALNWPITDVTNTSFACNLDPTRHKDSNLITIPQGAKVGAFWNHEPVDYIPGDMDSPISRSHLGPILAYLAAVPDAVNADPSDLQWFKVGHEGLNDGKWAVDNMIAAEGWWNFTMPTCVTAGQYLMKIELIALHGAFQEGGAQFYTECAQIQVTGSGTSNPSTVSFPGAYTAQDPGILLSIYDGNGDPHNSGNPYTIPGPPVLDCSGGGSSGGSSSSAAAAAPSATSDAMSAAPTTMITKTASSAKTVPTGNGATGATGSTGSASGSSGTSTNSGGTGTEAGLMEQCGGTGWTGPTSCSVGTCKPLNQWASLCQE